VRPGKGRARRAGDSTTSNRHHVLKRGATGQGPGAARGGQPNSVWTFLGVVVGGRVVVKRACLKRGAAGQGPDAARGEKTTGIRLHTLKRGAAGQGPDAARGGWPNSVWTFLGVVVGGRVVVKRACLKRGAAGQGPDAARGG